MHHGAGSLLKVKNSLGKVPLQVAKKEYTKEFLVSYERAYKVTDAANRLFIFSLPIASARTLGDTCAYVGGRRTRTC